MRFAAPTAAATRHARSLPRDDVVLAGEVRSDPGRQGTLEVLDARPAPKHLNEARHVNRKRLRHSPPEKCPEPPTTLHTPLSRELDPASRREKIGEKDVRHLEQLVAAIAVEGHSRAGASACSGQ